MAKLKETTVREDLYIKGNIYVWDYNSSQYTLLMKPATENELGGIIVGNNLTIDASGVLNSVRQPVDTELSLYSANPVENQAVTTAINAKLDKSLASGAASETNQLMDRASVETMISTNNSVFRGSFDTWALVPLDKTGYLADDDGNTTPKKGDYIVVNDASDYSSTKSGTWQFIYIGSWTTYGKSGWEPKFRMAETFTARQRAAMDSGITQQKVEDYDTYQAQINAKAALGHTHSAVDISGLKPIATSGEYKDIYNVPTAGNLSTPVYFGTDSTTKTGRPYACNFSISAAGSSDTPVYFKAVNGVVQPVACNLQVPASTGTKNMPVYIDGTGSFKACDFTIPSVMVGNTYKPVYFGSVDGKIKPLECSITINKNTGGAYKPIYINGDGTATTCNFTISAALGSTETPVYLTTSSGVIQPAKCEFQITKSTGSANTPIYIDANGKTTVCSYSINKNVPSDAIFTDNNVKCSPTSEKFYIAGTTSAAESTGTLVFHTGLSITNGKLSVDSITGKIIPSVEIVTSKPTLNSDNGWYKCNATIGGRSDTWLICKIDVLLIAYSTTDPRYVYRSIDNSNWYAAYAYWHA